MSAAARTVGKAGSACPASCDSRLERLKEGVLSACEDALNSTFMEFQSEFDAIRHENELLRAQLQVSLSSKQENDVLQSQAQAVLRSKLAGLASTEKHVMKCGSADFAAALQAPCRLSPKLVAEAEHMALPVDPQQAAPDVLPTSTSQKELPTRNAPTCSPADLPVALEAPERPVAERMAKADHLALPLDAQQGAPALSPMRLSQKESPARDVLNRELSNKSLLLPHHCHRLKLEFCIFVEHSWAFRAWSVILIACLGVSLWNDSLAIAQAWRDDFSGPLGVTWEWAVWIFFVIDIGINFNVAYEDGTGSLITSRRQIAKHYLKTYFIIDLISAAPLHIFMPHTSHAGAGTERLMNLAKVVKVFRIAKVVKFVVHAQVTGWLQDFMDDVGFFVGKDAPMSDLLYFFCRLAKAISKFIVVLTLEVHLIVCIMLSQSDDSRLAWQFNGIKASKLTPAFRYGAALWWSWQVVVTGTADVEFGVTFSAPSDEMMPAHMMQAFLTVISAVNLMIALSIFANTKGSDDTSMDFRIRRFGFFLRGQPRVSTFMCRMALAHHRLQQRVLGLEDVQELLDDLPLQLRKGLVAEIYAPAMENFGLFLELPFKKSEKVLTDLCGLMQPRHHLAHEVILAIGSVMEGMFFVLSGRVTKTENPHLRKASTSEHAQNLVLRESVHHASKGEEPIFGVECLFAGLHANIAPYSVLTSKMSTVAVISRDRFDRVVLQSEEVSHFVQFIRDYVASEVLQIDDLVFGVSPEIMTKFSESWQPEGETICRSEDLGLSAAYLTKYKHFKQDVVNEGFEDFTTTTFSALGHTFWGKEGNFRGFKGCMQHNCPRDGMQGSAIVDALGEDWNGRATHFVSWAWRYSVETVVSALSLWCEEHHMERSQVFFWMCFFCNNQRKMLINREECSLIDTFGDRLSKVGHMIILLDTYQGPYYTKRVWCIFETYVATTKGIKTDVAIPQSVKDMFNKILASGGFAEIAASLSDIDAETAVASHQSDEDEIKSMIRNSIGFAAVNETVKCALINWLAYAFGDCLKMHSIGEVARHIFNMLAGKNDAPSINLNHWLKSAREHPALHEYLGFVNMSPDESFSLLQSNIAEDPQLFLTMADVERFLHKQGKSSIHEFASWLTHVQNDAALSRLHKDLQQELCDKFEDLKIQSVNVEKALEELTLNNAPQRISEI